MQMRDICCAQRRREIRARLSSDDFLREVFEVVGRNEAVNRDICFSGMEYSEKIVPRLRECCRQAQAEMLSNSRVKKSPNLGAAFKPSPVACC